MEEVGYLARSVYTNSYSLIFQCSSTHTKGITTEPDPPLVLIMRTCVHETWNLVR